MIPINIPEKKIARLHLRTIRERTSTLAWKSAHEGGHGKTHIWVGMKKRTSSLDWKNVQQGAHGKTHHIKVAIENRAFHRAAQDLSVTANKHVVAQRIYSRNRLEILSLRNAPRIK